MLNPARLILVPYCSAHYSWVGQCKGYITVYIPAGLANMWGISQCTLQLGQPMWAAILQCLGWLLQVPYYNVHSSPVHPYWCHYNAHSSWVGPYWCHIYNTHYSWVGQWEGYITMYIAPGSADVRDILHYTLQLGQPMWATISQCTFQLGWPMCGVYYTVHCTWVHQCGLLYYNAHCTWVHQCRVPYYNAYSSMLVLSWDTLCWDTLCSCVGPSVICHVMNPIVWPFVCYAFFRQCV
jgi:hypothetical protein